jgi:hypothetical protein
MLYRFRSKAGAEVLMLAVHAEALLRALGREAAPEGVFLAEQIADALGQLDAAEQRAESPTPEAGDEDVEACDPGLRQRAWPLRELLQRAAAKGHPVTWQVA